MRRPGTLSNLLDFGKGKGGMDQHGGPGTLLSIWGGNLLDFGEGIEGLDQQEETSHPE
jgi:hypothetical protein